MDHAAVGDQAVLQNGPVHAQRRQVAHARVDDALRAVEVEGRLGAGQRQIGLVIGLDRAQILPVAIEDVSLNVCVLIQPREHFLAEIGGQGLGRTAGRAAACD